jgi:hypothetical protein
MTYSIPSSEKLKSLEKDLAKLKATAAISSAEIARLTSINRTDNIAVTVKNSFKETKRATIELLAEPASNRSSDTSSQEADRQADRDAVLKGLPLSEQTDVKTLLTAQHRLRGALEDALISVERDIRAEKQRLAILHSKELKPEYDKDIGIVFKSLLDLYPTLLRLQELKRHLVDDGIGYREGTFAINPETLFDNALNKNSTLANFLNEGVRLRYIKQLPKELA